MSGSKKTLARLVPVALREVWQHEGAEFTTWMKKQENLNLLSQVLGLKLELESHEKTVGIFRGAIVCRDILNDNNVLIANQLEQTDHHNLGQILTYAAGIRAATIIWLAQKIQEEHRAAIDWLNEITSPQFTFLGVEIQLWKLSDTLYAPTFNMVVKPINWSRTIAEQKHRAEPLGLTPIQRLQQEYWTAFSEFILKNSASFRLREPRGRSYFNFAIGKQNCYLTAGINVREKKISISLIVVGVENYRKFSEQRLQIENALGRVIWDERQRSEHYITIEKQADPFHKESWHEQHTWLLSKLELFHSVFVPMIKTIAL